MRRIISGSSQGPKLPGKAIIAIVDDDHSVRDALTSLVRSLGYVAMPLECAEDLLNSKHRRSVAYVIADLHMPGTTGLELHDRLVASGAPIPTILHHRFSGRKVAGTRSEGGRDWLSYETVQRGRLARVYSFNSRALRTGRHRIMVSRPFPGI